MDGLDHNTVLQDAAGLSRADGSPTQHTLKAAIDCVGVGLHTGRRAALSLLPAAIGTGIVFRRTDAPGAPDIAARHDHVVDTRLCTVLADPRRPELRVGTVEHVLAALAGCGVTNAIVAVDGPELPILDGSAAGFAFLIACAGLVAQDAPAPVIQVLRPVRVQDGAAYAELRPSGPGLHARLSIDFPAAAIGSQTLAMAITPASFASIAAARTFTQRHEVDSLRAAGLALGGSLDNAVVVDGAQVLNPSGLRMADEFVRHKLLDVVGDLALAGAALQGRFVANRTGHTLNNLLLRALFADAANYARDAQQAVPAGRSGSQNGRVALAAAPC